MNMSELCLDLRHAYRLVYSHQKAMLNLAHQVGRGLDLEFLLWESTTGKSPPGQYKNPASAKRMWDFIPLFCPWIVFSSKGRPKKGDIQLIVVPCPDTGYFEAEELSSAADLGQFPEASATRSEVTFWYVVIEGISVESEWKTLYDEIEWPEEDHFEISNYPGISLRGGNITYGMERFIDDASTAAVIADFRAQAKLK